MQQLSKILDLPFSYSLFLKLIGGKTRQSYIHDYVCAAPGQRVLDIGCGPADVLLHMPAVDYHGFDLNPSYIEAAKKRHGSRGQFFCEDVSKAVVADPGTFDIVMSNGVLHHLDDNAARCLVKLAYQALKPEGRACFIDPCYIPTQSQFTRFLLWMDRGRYIGSPDRYRDLAGEFFPDVKCHIREDLLRVPYSHCIMIAAKPGQTQQAMTSAISGAQA